MIAAGATLARALHVAAAAGQAGIPARLFGGVGVAALLGPRWPEPCRREPGDIDVAAPGRQRRALSRVLEGEGFAPDAEFNALHGRQRLIFVDAHGLRVDVVLDVLRMCHTIPLDAGFEWPGPSLPPWLLLVSKLQVVELTEKDLLDVAALLLGCSLGELEPDRIARDCADDWGLWRSLTGSLLAVERLPPRLSEPELAALREAATGLLERLDSVPKTLRWRLRSRVGERARWYELPESP
jgi:hypothetical protein